MAESITTRTNGLAVSGDSRAMRPLLLAIHANQVAILAALEAQAAKLDADTGVTDTDYAASISVTLGTKE
jgi:hypothetical protein